MTLLQFIKGPHRNCWVNEPNIHVYVRKAVHMINGEMIPCLDIGNVAVTYEKQGKGIFSKFLTKFERQAQKMGRTSFVEGLQNHRLKKFLVSKRGYVIDKESSPICPNAYKTFTK